MTFKYRYVGFGTEFISTSGFRLTSDNEPGEAAKLYENELAVDVGGVCWGLQRGEQPESRTVLDHHFAGAEFPSASAAVLHNAMRIRDKFTSLKSNAIWLVAHQNPDFDAFCASYLARSIIEQKIPAEAWQEFGLRPDGWTKLGDGEIDWFNPDARRFRKDRERRWAVLLAAYASCVDCCRRLACPKQRALHSILYTAIARGRDYESEDDAQKAGALEFFDEARKSIFENELHPLFDSILESSTKFAPELTILDRESELYERDFKRARRAIVNLKKAPVPFESWFPSVKNTPLLNHHTGRVEEFHKIPEHRSEQCDGIYLRDPECLLFKEWARLDTDNSSTAQGFVFTGVAYSRGRPDAELNQTEYYFSIDPERAFNRHLYNVWVRLQSEEIRAIRRSDCKETKTRLEQAENEANTDPKGTRTKCRAGFEGRAQGFEAFFDDPWFDGANYECTIVVTPRRGTLIGSPSSDADLSFDPVAELVRRELELISVYRFSGRVEDFAASKGRTDLKPEEFSFSLPEKVPEPAQNGYFRFASIQLDDDVDFLLGAMGQQVGRELWRVLTGSEAGLPTDFAARHLMVRPDWVGVWSRHGAAVAYKLAADGVVKSYREQFRQFAFVSRGVDELNAATSETPNSAVIDKAESLMRQTAAATLQVSLPENRLPARFFDAMRLDRVLGMLRDINRSAAERVERQEAANQTSKMTKNIGIVAHVQQMVEWIEVFIISVYCAHLWHMFAEPNDGLKSFVENHLAFLKGWYVSLGVILSATLSLIVALLCIKPWGVRSDNHPQAHVRANTK